MSFPSLFASALQLSPNGFEQLGPVWCHSGFKEAIRGVPISINSFVSLE